MSMSVNTNTAAMNAYRNLSNSNDAMGKSLERLSSGYRINRAADDAAGLAISEGLRSQIGGLTQAVRNTQDGTSVVQTAEGALDETTSILQRMRDLAVQASNDGGLNDDAKASIQKEMSQLKSELTRISDTTTFNGTKLLDGSYKGTFQVGANSGETISVTIGKAASASGLGVDGVDVTGEGNISADDVTETAADDATAGTLEITASGDLDDDDDTSAFGKLDGSITFGGKSFDLGSVDYSDADGDGDSTTAPTSAQMLTKLNTSAALALGLEDGTEVFTVSGDTLTFEAAVEVEGYTGAGGIALSDSAADAGKATPTFKAATGASNAIDDIDAAIKSVSSTRADLGAIQNRFEHTVNNLNTAIENTTASESRIRDTDMASEMTTYTSNQVLIQAGTAMLAQANQSTQSILKLLQG